MKRSGEEKAQPVWLCMVAGKVNSVQEACAKCFSVHLLKFEILQTKKRNKTKKHQNAKSIGEKLQLPDVLCFIF